MGRDFNIGTITVSLNYTLQVSHIKSSLHSRTFNWALLQKLAAISHQPPSLCSPPDCQLTKLKVKDYVTTDGQSASLPCNKAPIWGLWPDFYYFQTAAWLLMWGALSDEKTGLSFTISAGPRQHSHTRFRVPWESWPYFTVSDSRLPFMWPPTTRRATVEVLDPASTRASLSSIPRLAYNLLARTTQKTPFLCCCNIVAFVSVTVGTCLQSRQIERALVHLRTSRSLHSNGSTRYSNIRQSI
jgi:hypothetical protein